MITAKKQLYRRQALVRDVLGFLIVQVCGGVVIPEKRKMLRHSAVHLALFDEIGQIVLDHLGIVGKGARVARAILAVLVRDYSLVQDHPDKGSFFASGRGIALHAFQGEVATHGHDVTELVGVGEGDAVHGKLVFRNTDVECVQDWRDV